MVVPRGEARLRPTHLLPVPIATTYATAAAAHTPDIDSRAAQGDITFRDFLTMSKTVSGMGEDMSALPPGLSAKQILELREKITKHEKIVEARHARSPEPWAHAHARTHARMHTHTHTHACTDSPPHTPGDDG